MSRFNFGRASNTPPIVKNLIIINVVMFAATMLIRYMFRIPLSGYLGMFYFQSPYFQPWQIVTHMFMHGSFFHLLFNMWALWIFGKTLESVWGGKRFLTYYLVTGLGAAFFHELVMFIEMGGQVEAVKAFYNVNSISHGVFQEIFRPGNQFYGLASNLRIPTVGASGAVFGILLAFGMLFPNTPLMIIPLPVPIKAKWLVIGYGVLELYLGLTQSNSSVAHFAHLGGMIFGFILIKYWNKRTRNFY